MTTVHSRRFVDITLDLARQSSMRRTFAGIALVTLIVLAPAAASADSGLVIDFETPDVAPGGYSTDYSALEAQGVTVVSAFGIVEDDGNNWEITGNNRSQFIGVNGSPTYALRLEFADVYTGISIGCAVSSGNVEGDTLRLTLFRGADAVFTRDYTMAGVDAWQALFSYGEHEFDAVEVESLGPGPFGCDNLELDATALPTTGSSPATLVMWGAALLAMGALLARRRLPI